MLSLIMVTGTDTVVLPAGITAVVPEVLKSTPAPVAVTLAIA